MQAVAAADTAATALATDVRAPAPSRRLVVDDNEMNRDLLSRRLQRLGHETVTANDGREALRLMRYLGKPFNPLVLKARVDASLARKLLRDREQAHAQMLVRELEIGRQIQSGFLPERLPTPARPGQHVRHRVRRGAGSRQRDPGLFQCRS